MVIGPAEAVPARGVGRAQPLHRPRRAAAPGARPREPRRHARGARAPRPRVPRRDAGQRPGLRPADPPGQRPRQPGDRHLHLAPVGDDAAAAGRAGARSFCPAPDGSTPSATPRAGSPSTRPSRRTTRPSSTRTATSRPTPARSAAPGRSAATAVKKDARVFVLADSDCFDDEALPVGRQSAPGARRLALADGRRGLHGGHLDRGRRARSPTPASRTWSGSTATIFLGPGAGDRGRAGASPAADAPQGTGRAGRRAGGPPTQPAHHDWRRSSA